MRLLKALSLLAALALLGGAVLDAQTGVVRQALGAAPDAGKKAPPSAANSNNPGDDNFMPASKAGPLFRHREPQPQAPQSPAQQAPTQAAAEPRRDAGR